MPYNEIVLKRSIILSLLKSILNDLICHQQIPSTNKVKN